MLYVMMKEVLTQTFEKPENFSRWSQDIKNKREGYLRKSNPHEGLKWVPNKLESSSKIQPLPNFINKHSFEQSRLQSLAHCHSTEDPKACHVNKMGRHISPQQRDSWRQAAVGSEILKDPIGQTMDSHREMFVGYWIQYRVKR